MQNPGIAEPTTPQNLLNDLEDAENRGKKSTSEKRSKFQNNTEADYDIMESVKEELVEVIGSTDIIPNDISKISEVKNSDR